MKCFCSVNIDGLVAKIKAINSAAEAGLVEGVDAAASLFETAAKEKVPVLTGNLRDHIHTEQTTNEPTSQERTISPVYDADNAYGIDPAYARRIEFGFVGPDRLGRMYHQAPRPYMRPAFDENAAAAVDKIDAAVRAKVGGV